MKKPNFFLLGAPKSGSTALYTYLQTHPQIYFPRLKEPRYFASEFGHFREIEDLDEYESLYRNVPSGIEIIGDGSPWYLCSRRAIPAILEYSPRAKAVVVIRNPLDMLPSLHNQFLFSFKETEKDLQAAWRLQSERRQGRHVPPSTPSVELLQYGDLTSFGDQIERLKSQWPEGNLHVLLFEDFVADTQKAYREILRFLDLDDDGKSDFPVVNEAVGHKNQKLGWIFTSPASPVYRLIRSLRSRTKLRSTGVLAPFLSGNRERGRKNKISGDFRNELIEYYRQDVLKLSALLGRDLIHWLN